jgi:hypothetical protein
MRAATALLELRAQKREEFLVRVILSEVRLRCARKHEQRTLCVILSGVCEAKNPGARSYARSAALDAQPPRGGAHAEPREAIKLYRRVAVA